jgi:hypothetical protein
MSAKKRTEEVKQVKVNRNDSIRLTVIIGNGHIGSSTVKFRYTSAEPWQGEITDQFIGKGKDILGKTLRVVTRVLPASPNKKFIITHALADATPPEFIYHDEIGNNHDLLTLTADYLFIE